MKAYTITFKNKTIQEVRADRYIDEDDRLKLYVGNDEVARFAWADIVGIKESERIPAPVYGNPSERRTHRR